MIEFNAKQVKNQVVQWIKDWFEANGKGCNAVLGVSGGKDSSIVAALCVEALGKERVIGAVLDHYFRTGECPDEKVKSIIDDKHIKNLFKLKPIPYYEYKLSN